MHDESHAPPVDVPALTERMKRGDEAAWRQFHQLYFHRLLRYLIVLSGGREETARDALQATMLRAVRHVRRFADEETLWSWLTVLARSAFLDETRKHSRYRSMLDRFFHRETATTPSLAPSADARLLALLELNLARLSPEDRALLEQKYFAGDSVEAIANATHVTEKSIESRLVRIRRQLRALILTQLNQP